MTRLLVWSSVLAFPIVAVTLGVAGLGIRHAIYLGLLLALLPGLTAAQVPLVGDERLERAPVYVGSSIFLVILAGVSFHLGTLAVGVRGLGMSPFPAAPVLLAWVGALLVAAAAVILSFHLLGMALKLPESPVLAQLLPRTGKEKALFAALSMAAGLGEELAYRGYAITLLGPLLGSDWGAAVLTSAVFGVLHAYQGPLGIVRAGFLGLVLAAGFLLSGSLWPGIVAHAGLDLLGGLVLGDRLLRLT